MEIVRPAMSDLMIDHAPGPITNCVSGKTERCDVSFVLGSLCE